MHIEKSGTAQWDSGVSALEKVGPQSKDKGGANEIATNVLLSLRSDKVSLALDAEPWRRKRWKNDG